tara:strand:+ start:2012 stop:2227 length:216 start_codon:yes stop_codon:yes gene_type:complete
MKIPAEHIRITPTNKPYPGGQHTSRSTPTVTIEYLPDELKVTCGIERSQLRNKELAMRMLELAVLGREQKN